MFLGNQMRDGVWLAPEGALKVGDPTLTLLSSQQR